MYWSTCIVNVVTPAKLFRVFFDEKFAYQLKEGVTWVEQVSWPILVPEILMVFGSYARD